MLLDSTIFTSSFLQSTLDIWKSKIKLKLRISQAILSVPRKFTLDTSNLRLKYKKK